MFKYPVGAEVIIKDTCDHHETHRTTVVILSAFESTDALGNVRRFYAVETDAIGGRPFCIHENLVLGRVNVRPRAGTDLPIRRAPSAIAAKGN